jgi:3-deoxy-D-manno-octulosonic acid (KDO) 8-phosphate synthase
MTHDGSRQATHELLVLYQNLAELHEPQTPQKAPAPTGRVRKLIDLASGGLAVGEQDQDLSEAVLVVRHPDELTQGSASQAWGFYIPGTHCRQGDILGAVAASGRPVWVERGSFLSPTDVAHVTERFADATKVTLVEAGSAFGYDDRVLDVRALALYQSWGYPFALALGELCLGDAAESTYRPRWANEDKHLSMFAELLLRLAGTWGCSIVLKPPHAPAPKTASPSLGSMQNYATLVAAVASHLGITLTQEKR